ncbi:hypothetical protein MTX11_07880 [Acinetobacter lwoffii]|uniref:hypothetical protein n=1 Tax=Acinetobacter lwoffii TaxID=28090 RepID=UPI001FB36CCB|nr:hypothetical protein [Acinetobacter lwoffii]MCJ0927917.1 hypothetical protein [Acinetobacter lwoffii]
MSNYPKMLYKGNKAKYEHQTASNEESEKELLDSGWVGFGDLPEDPYLFAPMVPAADNSELKAENTKLKEELVEALKENQELRKQIRFKELEDKPADELKAILDKAEIKYKANAGKPELAQLVLDHESKDSE